MKQAMRLRNLAWWNRFIMKDWRANSLTMLHTFSMSQYNLLEPSSSLYPLNSKLICHLYVIMLIRAGEQEVGNALDTLFRHMHVRG